MSENDKFWYAWFGQDGVCYKDIDTFASSIPRDDDTIDMRIFCNGGNVIEGWAIYDRLRQSGKKISCTIEGKAASMATIIMLAAPKEDRHAFQNAAIMVHNPWIPAYAAGDCLHAKELRNMADEMQMWQDKMLDLYVERCGCDRQEMQNLMDKDMFINTDKAMEMGLIADTINPISASAGSSIIYNNINRKNSKSMAKDEKKIEVKASLIDKVLAKLGLKSLDDIEGSSEGDNVKAMELTTTDGQTLTVEREEGEPQVGDPASPDGTFSMPDGKTITVEDGVITNIQTDGEDGGDDGNGASGGTGASASASSPSNAQLVALQNQVNALVAERDNLKALLAKAQANARTKDDLRILNAVKMAGGEQKVFGAISSNYHPTQRVPDGKVVGGDAKGANVEEALAKVALLRGKKKK